MAVQNSDCCGHMIGSRPPNYMRVLSDLRLAIPSDVCNLHEYNKDKILKNTVFLHCRAHDKSWTFLKVIHRHPHNEGSKGHRKHLKKENNNIKTGNKHNYDGIEKL